MKYFIIPTDKLKEVSQDKINELGLSPRYSKKGNKVLIKESNYQKLFPDEKIEELPYPAYEGSSEDFAKLLSTEEWNWD